MISLKRISSYFRKSFNKVKDRDYKVGRFVIKLPYSHNLPEYQSSFKNYDKKLGCIINSLSEKDGWIIDIGANVGDTAALLRTYSDLSICCIEGDSLFSDYLKANCQQMDGVTVVNKYVSGRNTEHGNFTVDRKNGTAVLLDSGNNSSSVQMETLENIFVNLNINCDKIRLLKSDTDGFDFDILLSNKAMIKEFRMPLYFEYDIMYRDNDRNDSIELVTFLSSLGYKFVVYDNFGNLLTCISEGAPERFNYLNNYLLSCNVNRGGVNYFDVFAAVSQDVVDFVTDNDNKKIIGNTMKNVNVKFL